MGKRFDLVLGCCHVIAEVIVNQLSPKFIMLINRRKEQRHITVLRKQYNYKVNSDDNKGRQEKERKFLEIMLQYKESPKEFRHSLNKVTSTYNHSWDQNVHSK